MEITKVDIYDVDAMILFNVKNLDESRIKDIQVKYLKNKDNRDVVNKLINMFRDMNDSRYDDYSDEDILNIIIESIESDEFLYEYVNV